MGKSEIGQKLIVVAGPSGSGKSTLCKRLLEEFPEVKYSVSCTTREPRGEEKNGVAYHFITKDEFKAKVGAGEFLEHAEVHGNFYGTLKRNVEGILEAGGSVLMDIDVEGASQVRGMVGTLPQGDVMRRGFVDIFIDPPSYAVLRSRIEKRGEDSPEVIERRIKNAYAEIKRGGEFANRIVNKDVDQAYEKLKRVIMRRFRGKKLILLDLDGTVYAGEAAIPGAAEFVKKCAGRGVRCMYVTNRANRTTKEVCAQLAGMGIVCREQDVLTTAVATAFHIGSGSAYVIGEQGLTSALEKQGIRLFGGADGADEADGVPDYVVVSLDRKFTYEKLRIATNYLHAGASFIATNRDAYLVTENGIMPGSGALVSAVAKAAAKKPVTIGKPEPVLFEMALDICGVPKEKALVVGDNMETDIAAGVNAGVESVLMLTGVSTADDAENSDTKPDAVAENYKELESYLFEND